jgi:4-hydroxybenzoate polyprenyltransferase
MRPNPLDQDPRPIETRADALELTQPPADRNRLGDLDEAAEMIAFKHSIFALPFVLISLITAAGDGWPSPGVWFWVIIAMIAARTAAAHLWLGFALGIAPIGAWIAVTGELTGPPVVPVGAVTLWGAGFDTISSLHDEPFDRSQGLRSLPAWLGTET